ncbi:hypothetical protein [Paenibacillus assamensis]|uniref:hypothetical protein n=1 Tax=Paenibacillus assamensis TaxID=311244 RepID=UPI00040200D8|nr:hypothetical protein [Paenibacillus assamensis]
MKKKVVSFALSLCLAFSMLGVDVSAKDSQESIASVHTAFVEGERVTVKISPKAVGKVSKKQLDAIAKQAGNGTITIHNVHEAEQPINTASISWTTVKKISSRDNPEAAKQIISVARGATKKITKNFTHKTLRSVTLTGGVSVPSGASHSISGSITNEVSRSYTVEETWNGPAETSSFLSRIYYYTGFLDYGTFTTEGRQSTTTYGPYKGSYQEPTHYVEWSRDIK